jgi:hypothetical protein
MKALRITGGILFIVLSQVFFYCSSPDETYNRQIPAADTVSVEKDNGFQNYSRDFQNLLQSGEGVFRGVRLGLKKEAVKKKEASYKNSQIQEETSQYIDYMVDYGSLENTDLRYKLNDRGNVEAIEVNIYPNSKSSQDSLFQEFENYFSNLYGEGREISSGVKIWESKEEDLQVQMQKRDTHKVHDINLTFSYLNRKSAGILYEPLPDGL